MKNRNSQEPLEQQEQPYHLSAMNFIFKSKEQQKQEQQQQPQQPQSQQQQQKQDQQNKNKKKKKRKHSFDSIFSIDSELDEFDTQTVRFKPESLDNLVKLTKFNRRELKLMYRGFKQLCPSGVVKEDKFKLIYAQFFPRGAETNGYARFVFNSFDIQRKQEITFTDFVIGLSVLTRGTIDEQLRWIFTLYDINGDGIITRDELNKIVNSIHDLMGKFTLNSSQAAAFQQQTDQSGNNCSNNKQSSHFNGSHSSSNSSSSSSSTSSSCHQKQSVTSIKAPTTASSVVAPAATAAAVGSLNAVQSNEEQAESLFRKFDLNNDGVITLDEFLEACHKDDNIIKSISVFNTIL